MQEWASRSFRCPPRDINNIQSQVGLRRLKCQGLVPPSSPRCPRLQSTSAGSPGPPPRASRLRVPGAEASAAIGERARGRQAGSRLTTAGPRSSALRIPARCHLAASPRSDRPQPAFAFRYPSRGARGLGGFARRRRKRTERRRVPGSRRRRATRSPRAPFPDAGLPRSDASSAEVSHVDRSLASHKMGPAERPPPDPWAPPFCEARRSSAVCNG